MVAWNPEGEYIVTKGGNVDVKNLTPNGRLIPVFYPFDIVLLNGEVLANRPLKVINKRFFSFMLNKFIIFFM